MKKLNCLFFLPRHQVVPIDMLLDLKVCGQITKVGRYKSFDISQNTQPLSNPTGSPEMICFFKFGSDRQKYAS